MARLRNTLVAIVFAILAGGLLACQPQTILSTISCPVYQPPATPQPEWPKQCGGTR